MRPRPAGREFLPLFDEFDDHAPGTLTWLQAWYAAQCDGVWEHGYGISIETLDNPGWSLKIGLRGIPIAGTPFVDREVHRGEHDWIVLQLAGEEFRGSCGPLNLGEVIHEFRLWAEGPPRVYT